ncbi:MAG: hypothetical protein IPM29_04640 [Planctomycetes bacterium]|nr:hypothetical protein [Planctomycetota bacterium]
MNKLEFLRSELTQAGFRPQVHDDYVAFRHAGGNYVIPVDDEDEIFVRVVFPNFWKIGSAAERGRALETAALICANLKNVKVFPQGDNTVASVDLLLPGLERFREVLPRAVQVLQAAAQHFCLAMAASGAGGFARLLHEMIERLRRAQQGGGSC